MFSFGFNSFWNSMHGSRAVQELLNKPDLKLDELLEEDGLLSELKTQNQRLLSLILREENFKKLISYVILEPDAEEAKINQKKGYKYPFVCADVLSSDIQAIVSEFFKTQKDLNEDTAIHKAEEIEDDDEVNTESPDLDKEESTETSTNKDEKSVQEDKSTTADANSLPYLDYLFTFLDSNEMNLTSAGYFAKIANNLFAKKPSELITYLYEQKPILLEKMANHISSKSIAEFLAKVLTFESTVLVSNEDEVYNTKRKEILQLLLKKLEPKQDLEEINNTAYLICEVLGKYNTMHCSQEILQNLLDKRSIDYFFELLKTKDANTCCAVGLILGNIFAYYILMNTPKIQYSTEEITEGEPPAHSGPQHFELTEDIPLLAVFISNLETIVQYIINTSGKSFTSQYGVEVTPFGSARLKLVELIIIAMKANNHKIYSKLVEHGFLSGLLELFTKYEWNNMLHNQVEKVINLILDSNYQELKISLFEKTKILDFIINAVKPIQFTMTGKHERKIRKGYIGQLTRMANKLTDSKDPEIRGYVDKHEGWEEFVQGQLADINQKNNINLGGKDPRAHEEEEYNDSNPLASGLQFSDFFPNKGAQNNDDNDNNDDDDEEEDDNQAKEGQHEKSDSDEELNAREEGDEPEDDDEQQVEEKSLFKHDESNQVIQEKDVHKSDDYNQEEDEEGIVNKYSTQTEGNGFKNLESVKIDEVVLDAEFNSNTYWKRESWHSAEDILSELQWS